MYFLWYRMALDLIETKMYKPRAPKAVKSIPNYKITIPFVNKALDYINLPQILRSNEVKSNIPDLMEVLDIPMIVHCLKPSIQSRVLNYKKFVKNLDLKSFCRSQKSISCHCREYNISFVDPNAKHVLTGDLNIIKNNKLRKLLSKGPKYREPVKIDWMEARFFLLRTH
jgi:chromosome condensin MukBEF complex kleisin-like MukF subunit